MKRLLLNMKMKNLPMNKTELAPEDLSKAIQFLKDNAISPDEVSLDRLVGWINAPRDKPRYKGESSWQK
jgi:hypothetical protein